MIYMFVRVCSEIASVGIQRQQDVFMIHMFARVRAKMAIVGIRRHVSKQDIFKIFINVLVCDCMDEVGRVGIRRHVGRGGGLGSRPIFKKFHETYAPS